MRRGLAPLLAFAALVGGSTEALAELDLSRPLHLAIGVACPERAELVRALGAEGIHVRDDGSDDALSLALRSRGALVVVQLTDGDQILLERALSGADCRALAETVALLVARRVEGVDGEVALPDVVPAPPAPTVRTARLAAEASVTPERAEIPWALTTRGGALVSSGGAGSGATLGPFVGATLGSPGVLAMAASVGWAHDDAALALAGGSLAIDRVPIALGLGAQIRSRRWALGAYATLEAEVFRVESDLPRSAVETRAALSVGPTLSVAFEPIRRLSVGADVAGLVRAIGYRFVVDGLGDVGGQSLFALQATVSIGYRTGGPS